MDAQDLSASKIMQTGFLTKVGAILRSYIYKIDRIVEGGKKFRNFRPGILYVFLKDNGECLESFYLIKKRYAWRANKLKMSWRTKDVINEDLEGYQSVVL